MSRNRPDNYGWWDWQIITNGRWNRLYLSYGWIFGFLPLILAGLIVWLVER